MVRKQQTPRWRIEMDRVPDATVPGGETDREFAYCAHDIGVGAGDADVGQQSGDAIHVVDISIVRVLLLWAR